MKNCNLILFILFFSLRPKFGSFKQDLNPQELVEVVDNPTRDGDVITYKVAFKRLLRPSHSLVTEFQKKKKKFNVFNYNTFV